MAVETRITIGHSVTGTKDSDSAGYSDLADTKDPLTHTIAYSWSTGYEASQADDSFHDQRTVAAGTTDLVDFFSELENAFGDTVEWRRVKHITIQNTNSDGDDEIQISWGEDTPSLWPYLACVVRGGGSVTITAPDETSFNISAGNGEILSVSNEGSNAVTYNIIAVGVQT